MRWIAIVFALEIFIELTQPGGGKLLIEESHIIMMRVHMGNCTGRTVIVTSNGTLCVMESQDEIRRLIREAK
jgi:hypothetical protein